MAEKNSLWKNKSTTEMIRQERKIKAKKYAEAGPVGEDKKEPIAFEVTGPTYEVVANNPNGKPKPNWDLPEGFGGYQKMEPSSTRVAPVVNHVKEAQYRAQAAKDVKNPKITDDDFRDKHGYNKHVYQMNNDPKYKAEVEANAKELVKKNGSIDLPSTYMDSKSFTGNPNLNYMIPNGLTGEARKAYEESQMNVVNAALPIPGLQQVGRLPSIGTGLQNFVRAVGPESGLLSRFVRPTESAINPVINAANPVVNSVENAGNFTLSSTESLANPVVNLVDDVNYSKYLTQEEAVAARGERLISQKNKPGWDEQLTSDLEQRLSTAVERHNPASDLEGISLGANTAGRTATEVSKNAISKQGIPLNEANKARIAAHEVGHYYSNSPAEGKEWASHFDFSKLSQRSRDYLMGKGWKGRNTDYANEVRERAAQLKDYIAQKNGIPLNQDFIITESMLDDAITNYVKNTGLDNSMSEMLGKLVNKKGLLKTMNKFALGTTPLILTGAGALQNKKEGGYLPTQGPPKALFKGYAEGGYSNPYQQYAQGGYVNQYATGSFVTEEGEDGKPIVGTNSKVTDEGVAYPLGSQEFNGGIPYVQIGPGAEVFADKPDYLKAYDEEYERRMNEQKAFQEAWYRGQDYDKTPLENRAAMAANDAAAKIIIERKKSQGDTADKYNNRQEFLKIFNDKEKSIIGNSNLAGYIGPDAGSSFRAALNNIHHFGKGFKNTDPDLTQEEANNISRWNIFSPLGVPGNIVKAALMGDDIGGTLHGRASRPWTTSDERPMGMEDVTAANILGDIAFDPLNLAGMGIGKNISNALKLPRKIAAPSYFAKPVENIANFTLKAKDARDNIVRGAIGSKQLFDQVIGELARGRINKRAIEEGNKYLENWIQNKATQDKIDADIPADIFDNQTMIDPSTNKQYLFNIPELIKKQAKNFKPNSKEYSLLQQFKHNIDQYLGVTKQKSIHGDNWGVSYKHNYDPIERQLVDLGLMGVSNRYGSWVSRINKLSPFKRAGTTLHENVHDWVDHLTIDKSGMRDMVLNNLNPDYLKDFHEWEALHAQGIDPASIMGDYRAFRGYMANPTEIHARTMELRRFFNITPDQFVTDDFAKQMVYYLNHLYTKKNTRHPITGLGYYLNALDNDPQKVSTVFNKLWGVVPAAVVGTAIPSIGKTNNNQSKATGGYTNPYNQYQDDPYNQYKVGGKVWQGVGNASWNVLSGTLNTITGGLTTGIMDKGEDALQKMANPNFNPNDPNDVKAMRQIDTAGGAGEIAGSLLGLTVNPANIGSAVAGTGKGANDIVQSSTASDSAKQWSQGISGIAQLGHSMNGVPSKGSTSGGANTSKFGDVMKNFSGSNFGKSATKAMPYVNQAVGMIGGNKGSLLEQGVAAQDYLNSPEYLELQRQGNITVNQGINFSQGGNITNNSLNLHNTMRYKRFAQGGTFDQYGINMIPDSAGLHHESAYGGVPIGPDALAEGGEIKMDTGDGGQYIVSDQVDGAETQKDFMFSKGGKYKELNRTLADGMKQDLNKYTFGSLATSDRVKGDLRRPNDSYGQSTVEQIKQKWQQKTEYARQRSQQDQAIAQAEEQKRMAEEQYIAAYGGRINPKKYPGLNMTKKAKGGYVYNPMTQPMLAQGGPIYGDPASEYVYARGGQIDYTNDMYSSYAGGGPMVSNVNQPFNGPSAQNRGGMYLYPDGGMMPPEQQMMQEQMMQEQAPQEQMQQQGGGQEQMMQIVEQVIQALMQGAQPEQIMQQLVQSGVPQDMAMQAVQMAMQEAQGQMQQQEQGQQMQQGQQPMQGQEQMMPPQGMMARGGRMYYEGGPDGPPYDLPGMADMNSSEYNSVNSYLTNLNTPNFVDNQGNTSSILSRMSNKPTNKPTNNPNAKPLNLTGWNTPNQSIQGPYDPNRPEPITKLNRLKQNYFDTSNSYNPNPTLPNNELGSMTSTAPTSPFIPEAMPYDDEIDYTQIPTEATALPANNGEYNFTQNKDYGIPGSNSYSTDQSASWEDETELPTVGTAKTPNGLGMNFKSGPQMGNQVTELGKLAANNNANTTQNTDTPWSEEPWYSKASRYSQAIPGIAATVTGMLNKKRKLTPSLMTAQTVNYEPARITDRRESNLKYNKYADTVRNMGNQGYGNLKDALLNSNTDIAGRNAKSVMDERNTNAQLAQQANMTNTGIKNQYNQLNEQMFQNAQTQALVGLGDTTGKLANTAQQERKQYLQEWIAKNRLKTRNYSTEDSGEDVYSNNTDGYFYDSNGNRVSR